MDVARWEQIKELFHTAIELDAAERAALLAAACGDDAELRREVELLLSANQQASGFLNSPALQQAAQSLADDKQSTQQFVPAIGQEFSHYNILSRIGAGGMGEVYLARDARLKRRVALKLLPLKFTQDAVRLQRFIREAEAASALNHPNIITIYEIGVAETERGQTHFIATEYIEGTTLREWQPEEESKRLIQALELGSQIASALDAAHQAGIVHRDIKPDNLMVRPDGLVKVLDFGLAKLTATNNSGSRQIDTDAETTPAEMQTLPGVILGTLRYMSPEQARGRLLDARTDIFSLGVVLHELLAGKPLFEGETTADVIAAIIHKEPPPLSTYLPDAPPELERILRKTLAKDCSDRYQTARDLQIDLRAFKHEWDFAAISGRTTDRKGRVKTNDLMGRISDIFSMPTLLNRTLMVLLAGVLLLGIISWLLTGRGSEPDANLPASLKTVEVTSWRSGQGEVQSAGSLSPDGRMIAFASARNGNCSIWVTQTIGGEVVQVTKDQFINTHPIWSSSNSEIAYLSFREGQTGIWRIPYLGGTPVLIKPLADASAKLIRWSNDGATIYFASYSEFNKNLQALDLKSQQITPLLKFDTSRISLATLTISRDESQIAYVATGEDKQDSIWVTQAHNGTPVKIATHQGECRNLIWHPDNKRIFYSSNVDGLLQIFVAYTDGRKPLQLTFGDENKFALDASADGTKVLYASSREESDIWKVNFDGTGEMALTTDLASELWPDISPDSTTIAFQSIRNLSQGDKINYGSLVTKSSALEGQRLELGANGFLPKWAPDGKLLAFMHESGADIGLCVIKATGGEVKQLVSSGLISVDYSTLPYNHVQTSYFSWSPDGHRIVYPSDKGGQINLWSVAVDDSTEEKITHNVDPNQILYCPIWSPDGSQIVYSSRLKKDGKLSYSVWLYDSKNKETHSIYQSNSYLRLVGWSQSEKQVLLATYNGERVASLLTDVGIIQVDVRTGRPHPVADFHATYLFNVHLSVDRKMIALVMRRNDVDNIWLVPAAGGEVRKLTANNDPKLYLSSLAWSPDSRTIYFGKQSRHSLLSMLNNLR